MYNKKYLVSSANFVILVLYKKHDILKRNLIYGWENICVNRFFVLAHMISRKRKIKCRENCFYFVAKRQEGYTMKTVLA